MNDNHYYCEGVTMNMEIPKYSKWRCHLFGARTNSGLSWRPLEGCEPNWFWRWMQYICFGCRWVKD